MSISSERPLIGAALSDVVTSKKKNKNLEERRQERKNKSRVRGPRFVEHKPIGKRCGLQKPAGEEIWGPGYFFGQLPRTE